MKFKMRWQYAVLLSSLFATSIYAEDKFTPDADVVIDSSSSSQFLRRFNLKETSDEIKEQVRASNEDLVANGNKKLMAPHFVPLPASVDNSQFAKIFDQGNLGSCTSNSAAQCLYIWECKDYQRLNPHLTIAQVKEKVKSMSRLFHYYCESIMDQYGDINSDQLPEDNGSSIGTSLLVLHKLGVPYENHWPYVETAFKSKPSKEAYDNCKDNKDITVGPEMLEAGDTNAIKRALRDGAIVQAGILLGESFQSDETASTGMVKVPNFSYEKRIGGHAIAIVGYDDNIVANGVKGAFICANSWGQQWGAERHGQRGFFYLPYAYVHDTNLTVEVGQYSNMCYNIN